MITGEDGKSGPGPLIDQRRTARVYRMLAKEDQLARWRDGNPGVVFQLFQLLPNLNLIENINMAMDMCHTYPVCEHEKRALEVLDQAGIAEHVYRFRLA